MNDERISSWRLAGRLARYRPGMFLLSFAVFAAASSSMLVIGWLLQQIFDAMSGGRQAGPGIYGIVAVLAAVELARIAASWAGVVRSLYWEQLRGLLRLNLLRAQMASGRSRAAHTSPGEAVSRFRDDVDDFLAFLEIAVFVAGELLFAVGSIVIMMSIDPLITIAVVLPLVTVVFTTRMTAGQIRRRRAAYRRASAAVTGLLGEMFGAVLAVKTAHAGSGVLDRLTELNDRRRRTGLRDQLVAQLLDTFNHVAVTLSVGLVLLLAIPGMRGGGFSVGDLALFASYVGTLVAMPRYTGRLLANYKRADVAVERMSALLPSTSAAPLVTHRPLFDEQPPGDPLRPRGSLQRLEVRGLTAVDPGSGRGVRDIDLTIARGTFTVITGPAGAARRRCCALCSGSFPPRTESCSGTVSRSATAPRSSSRHTPHMCRRRLGCSASPCRTTCCSASTTPPAWRRRCVPRSWTSMWLPCRTGWPRRSALAVCGSPAGRCSGRPSRGHWCAAPTCWSSTTSPARWTCTPNGSCGTGCSRGGTAPCSSCRTAPPPSPAQTRSSALTRDASNPATSGVPPSRCAMPTPRRRNGAICGRRVVDDTDRSGACWNS